MESSDEEGEILSDINVSEYFFVDQNNAPISFDVLPLQWDENEVIGDLKTHVFIHGDADNGLQRFYKQVVAWKFELGYLQPEILVLSKEKRWIKLQKPRKCYQSMIWTILITIHWLSFLKMNTEASAKHVWNHLERVFSTYEFKPSENALLCHKLLIGEAVKRDKDLTTSKIVLNLLEMPKRNITFHQDAHIPKKDNFIVEGDIDEDYNNDDNIGEEDDVGESLFDPVCAICDNGGNVLCCTGRCLRSFHPTKVDGIESSCESLGFVNQAQIDAIPSFMCKNCIYKQHQCYACGELGSSDSSSGQEVFPCVSATCGHFYHPKCVAKLLHAGSEAEAETLGKKIASGDPFTCPIHKCFVCKQSEDAEVNDLQFAVCRRCPRAYHRICLPKGICFQYDTNKNSLQRAWEGLLPYKRILIYCMEHKMIKELETPSRDHLIFPDLGIKEKKQKQLLLSYKGMNLASKRSGDSEDFPTSLKKPKLVEKTLVNTQAGSRQRTEKHCPRQDISPIKIPNTFIADRRLLQQDTSSDLDRYLAKEKNKISQTKSNLNMKLQLHATASKQANETGKIKNINQNMPTKGKMENKKPLFDAEIEKGVLALVKDVDSSFSAEEFMKKHQEISVTKVFSFRSAVDKTITWGRVEASVKAVRTALEKLEAGGSLQDAKSVCGPEVLQHILKWKENLAVYLGPFLHGLRYTSFGRHFTKVEKLKEVVNRLHWYAQDGDTIVDFCCGSNDFSSLLKEKLEKAGKSCSFKNYDLFQPKNDFNFEKRDWMSVKLDELPDGSKLIMGLNPPFGVKASRANKFINKALKFRPKLIVLIVPKETRRLDETDTYDLIWEDDRILAGKSFYLPGSVDINDKHLDQWNLKPPPLYLWSRSDWTIRHKTIAQEHCHAYDEPEEMHKNKVNSCKEVRFNYLMEETNDCYGDFSKDVHACGGIYNIFDGVPEANDGFESEGSRGSIHGKFMEGHFPLTSSIWNNYNLTMQHVNRQTDALAKAGLNYGTAPAPEIDETGTTTMWNNHNLTMQHVHRQTDALTKAGSDYGTAPEIDEMCIDMEVSSGNTP